MGVGLPPFQRLLDSHGTSLHRFLAAAVGPDDADDCFQETVMAALRAYPRLRHADDLRAWLFTIARRPLPTGEVPDRAAPDDPQPRDDVLWAHVRALPERQRTAVSLRYVCDLPYADIARAMRCSPDAARQSVSAGLARLRGELT
jgi:DNA-directed RNA polymerase specialized sigma24 family protein